MEQASRVGLTFWGVRGSTPTPQPENLGIGGNTTCIEVLLPDGTILIIDAGTGIRNLGASLAGRFPGQKLVVNVLLTHFHWDHIQGIPFFAPLYSAANQVIFHSALPADLREVLEGQMSHPYFPVEFDLLSAVRTFKQLGPEPLKYPGVTIHPFPLHHPQGASGYRIETNGTVIVHASDFEHGNARLDKTVRDYATGADVLIYDAQYTPEEYESKRGWGHSTWLEATRVARDAKVKRLILFHHDPSHGDPMMTELAATARAHFEPTDTAREGGTILL